MQGVGLHLQESIEERHDVAIVMFDHTKTH